MFERSGIDTATGLRYLNFIPTCRGSDAVVVFLHGSGERGLSLDTVKAWGLPRLIAEGVVSLDCNVVCPQLRPGTHWGVDQLCQFIAPLNARRQVRLTGFSKGGTAIYDFVAKHSSAIAAAAPVAGRSTDVSLPLTVSQGVKLLAVYGELDDRDPTVFVDNFRAEGGSATQWMIRNHGHYISEIVYADPKFYEWAQESISFDFRISAP